MRKEYKTVELKKILLWQQLLGRKKESFAKALGTGFRNDLNFKDIEIMNDKFGKPYYSKTKKITQIIRKEFKIKNFDCFLSISDEKEYSTAFTIIESIWN